jgi:glycosyltransferase involved in cell wall biosynthesis
MFIMQHNLPLISIVTPSYNQERFLERTIQSVLSQNYLQVEYQVIDGNSSDGSVEIIKRYADKLAYWVSEPDRSHYQAINKGLARSQGEIMAYLCSDDTYEPGALLYVGKYFQEHADCDLLVGGFNYIDERDRILWTSHGEFNKAELICGTGEMGQPAIFWRKKVYEKFGGFLEDSNYHRDLEYWLRCGDTFKFHNTRKVLANYRFHNDSHSCRKPRGFVEEYKKVMACYGGRYPETFLEKLSHPVYLKGRLKWQVLKAMALLKTGNLLPHLKKVVKRRFFQRIIQ